MPRAARCAYWSDATAGLVPCRVVGGAGCGGLGERARSARVERRYIATSLHTTCQNIIFLGRPEHEESRGKSWTRERGVPELRKSVGRAPTEALGEEDHRYQPCAGRRLFTASETAVSDGASALILHDQLRG